MMKMNTNKINVKDSNRQVLDNMGMCTFLLCESDSLITTICCVSYAEEEKRE